MLLESAFLLVFCLSNWLLFLKVMQENKSGCFSEHSVYRSYFDITPT